MNEDLKVVVEWYSPYAKNIIEKGAKIGGLIHKVFSSE